jgi:hypothetical protein
MVVSGCSEVQERLWLKAPGWGRAEHVTNTAINDPASIAIDDQGRIYLLVVDREEELFRPRLIQLNRRAEKLWERTFHEALSAIDEPRVLWDGINLQVFWISRHNLYRSQVNASGDILDDPAVISGVILVDTFDVEFDPENGLTVWFAGTEETPGLYALPPGDLGGGPGQVDPLGLAPDIQYDQDGVLHAIWWHDDLVGSDNRIFYGSYPGGRFQLGHETDVYEVHLQPSDGFEGPLLGIDQDQAYIIWTLSIRTGLRAGTIEASYIHFPLHVPENVSSRRVIAVPVEYDLDFLSLEGVELDVGKRIPLDELLPGGTSVISNIAIQPVVGQELAIAARIRGNYLMNKMENQIGTIFLTRGTPSSYQLLSFTATDSTSPAIIGDTEGFLYMTWLEKVGERGRAVYFTSTTPDIRDSISSLTTDDFRYLGLEISFGMLMGVLMTPFVLIWLIAPIIVLGLTSRIRKEDEGITGKGTIISIVLALLAYWLSKVVILPTMWDYVPFSSWIPFIPEMLETPLRYAVPLVIASIGFFIAWNLTYRRERNSVLFFTLLYAAVDGVLTMAIYGVIILAAV